ncbi:MAG TPA: 16S rRNA (guanine(527)-N(7))-methyltransferase RsmG [Peptococcaceae bacterium]|nr:16S rRNA (guanine(527)-N(7))-methyltransferase RsmG [Peptococcaceae bacterium]
MEEHNLEPELNLQMEMLSLQALEELKIKLSPNQLEQFSVYTKLILDWNERINLTAITNPEEIRVKHFLDSLVFVKKLQEHYQEQSIYLGDLGTGAGFPGIPLKIVKPELEVVLIDALAKRINFLTEVIETLKLTGIRVLHARAEDIGKDPKFREKFDVITARAVAELPVLLEYAIPLLKVGGRLLAAKGMEPEKELQAAAKAMDILNCREEQLEKYTLGQGADYRSMIIIQKLGLTPAKYPRPAGKPKKNPL